MSKEPTWELLAALVGYLTSVEPAIYLIGHRFLGQRGDEITRAVSIWVALIYALIFLGIITRTLYRVSEGERSLDSGIKTSDDFAKNYYIPLKIFRSFGFTLIHWRLLRSLGVRLYDGFNRGPDWDARPEMFNHIDRFLIENKTIEFQYSRDYRFIEFREAGDGNEKFGPPQKYKWREVPHRWLTLFSITGFWCSIVNYLFCRR